MARASQKKNSKKGEIEIEVVTTQQAAEAIKKLIHSLNASLEQKVAFEDQINNLIRDIGSLLDEIDSPGGKTFDGRG